MDGRSRRGNLGVIADILGVCLDVVALKTNIVYRANLNFNLATKYIDELVEKRLLRIQHHSRRTYETTEKGREFLELYGELKQKIS